MQSRTLLPGSLPISTQQSKLEGPDSPISHPIQVPLSLKCHHQTDTHSFWLSIALTSLEIQICSRGTPWDNINTLVSSGHGTVSKRGY